MCKGKLIPLMIDGFEPAMETEKRWVIFSEITLIAPRATIMTVSACRTYLCAPG